MYNIKGQLTDISDTKTWDSGFSKREFIVTEPGEYPNPLKIEAVKDSISKLDGFSVGDEVSVDVFVNGNEYNGKHYVNLRLAKIEKVGTTSAQLLNGDMAEQFNEQQSDGLPF